MAAIDSKFHIKIGDYGFMLAKQIRTDRHIYGREEAPSFVNKVSSGDPNYRDSTFFPHFVQNNWLNGFDQEKVNDGGKFYRSSGLDPTIQEKLQLEKRFYSAGQAASAINIETQAAWRAAGLNLINDANLVSYFPFENSILDEKSNNNLTNTGSTDSASGKFGHGRNFALASSQYLKKTTRVGAPTGNGAFSMSAWFNFNSSATSKAIMAIGVDGASNTVAGLYLDLNGLLRFEAGGGTNACNAFVVLSPGSWYHAVATYDGAGTSKLYINGVLIKTTTSLTYNLSVGDLNIGSWVNNTAFFDGSIDDVALFSRALTLAEVVYLSNNSLSSSTSAFTTPIQYVGGSDGKIYSWDGALTYTEVFDTRKVTWFESNNSATAPIGDGAGTEYSNAQSFQIDATMTIKAIEAHLRKSGGTPGDITVRIETNNAGVPSGTLANANATATIPAFTTSTGSWINVEFTTAFQLTASTTYWLVLKTAAAANDNYYEWTTHTSGDYAGGNRAQSLDGGATWSSAGLTAHDMMFRIKSGASSVNTMLVSSITGTRKLYAGAGSPNSTTNGDAKLFSFDGTTWALVKVFNTTDESCILSMTEFGSTTNKVYLGLGATAKVYVTSDMVTFTLNKTFTQPNNPGYVLALKEYSGRLYAAGGYPQLLLGNSTQYSGFLYSYDEFSWTKVGEFDHTVLTCLEVFDNLLFLGTINKRFYVYNTASIDKLLDLPWDVQMTSMTKWDDKLAFALAPTPGFSASGFEGIYLFDRNGFHNAFSVISRSWYSLFIFNNNLMGGNDDGYVYQTDSTTYQATGTLQMSYFEAALPSIDKLWRSVVLHFEALPTGGSITIDYKTDESDASWTSLGSYSTVGGTTTTLTFPVAFYSKKISLRITLATSTNTNTPALKIVDLKYVVFTDFKYLWKMKVVCPDNIVWLDGTQPISTAPAAILVGATTLPLASASGFPTAGRGVVVDAGVEDEFTWTGKSGNSLTGCSGLLAHTSTGLTVKITGAMMHKQLLVLKQAKTLYTFTDIDGLTYTVLFHQYQADDFVVNQTDGLENNAPITLLEA